MIFMHTWELVLNEIKTQTRRRKRDTDSAMWGNPCVIGVNKRGRSFARWEAGETYAIQPARGAKSVGRILVKDICSEDVRSISQEDAIAEGFSNRAEFWDVWTAMHDKGALDNARCAASLSELLAISEQMESECIDSGSMTLREMFLWDALSHRPNHLYQAWVITFELVKDVQ